MDVIDDVYYLTVIQHRHLIIRNDLGYNRLVAITSRELLTNLGVYFTHDMEIKYQVAELILTVFPLILLIEELTSSIIEMLNFMRVLRTTVHDLSTSLTNLRIVFSLCFIQIHDFIRKRVSLQLRIITEDIDIIYHAFDIEDLIRLIIRNGKIGIFEVKQNLIGKQSADCDQNGLCFLSNHREWHVMLIIAIDVTRIVVIVDTDSDRFAENRRQSFRE